MVATLTKPRSLVISGKGYADFGDSGGGSSPRGPDRPFDAAQIGLIFFLATITMLFAGVISALVIRRASGDWRPIDFPAQIWINTAILLVSSVTLEISRTSAKRAKLFSYRFWINATALSGVAFLAGQVAAWRQLAAQGVYLPSGPHASFFYLLTGLHAVHLLGGIIVLLLASARAWSRTPIEKQLEVLTSSAIYWHFLDILWVALITILSVM